MLPFCVGFATLFIPFGNVTSKASVYLKCVMLIANSILIPYFFLLCRYPKDTKPKFNNLKTKKASSFHEFARSTNDAWDIDDEEDEDFLGTLTSYTPSGQHSTSPVQNQVTTQHLYPITEHLVFWSGLIWIVCLFVCSNQQQHHQAGDTEGVVSPPRTEVQNLQDVEEENTECEHVNGKVVKSNSDAHLNTSSGTWRLCTSSSFYHWEAYQVNHREANY